MSAIHSPDASDQANYAETMAFLGLDDKPSAETIRRTKELQELQRARLVAFHDEPHEAIGFGD